jgi:hypothetical protein
METGDLEMMSRGKELLIYSYPFVLYVEVYNYYHPAPVQDILSLGYILRTLNASQSTAVDYLYVLSN